LLVCAVLVIGLLYVGSLWREERRLGWHDDQRPEALRGGARHFGQVACTGCALPGGGSFALMIWDLPPDVAAALAEGGLDYANAALRDGWDRPLDPFRMTEDRADCVLLPRSEIERTFGIDVPQAPIDRLNAAFCTGGAFLTQTRHATILIDPGTDSVTYLLFDPV
jgi:hypothetical protein